MCVRECVVCVCVGAWVCGCVYVCIYICVRERECVCVCVRVCVDGADLCMPRGFGVYPARLFASYSFWLDGGIIDS